MTRLRRESEGSWIAMDDEYFEYEIDADLVRAMTRRVRRLRFRSPLTIALIALNAALLAYGIAVVWRHYSVLGELPTNPFALGAPVLLVALLFWQLVGSNLLKRRVIADSMVIGTKYALRLSDDELTLIGPESRSETSYRLVRDARYEDGLLIIEFTTGYRSVFPQWAVPHTAVDRINGAAQKARA